jgi:hypothetical protein
MRFNLYFLYCVYGIYATDKQLSTNVFLVLFCQNAEKVFLLCIIKKGCLHYVPKCFQPKYLWGFIFESREKRFCCVKQGF